MLSQFNDLLLITADDGASAPVTTTPLGQAQLADELLEAWHQERHERIETRLYLDQARALLRKILADGEVSDANRRRARRLLLAIESSGPGAGS